MSTTTQTTKQLKKVVRLGRAHSGNIFCKIKIEDGKLSISGVEGPTRDGNCKGYCGQINMGLRDRVGEIAPAPGWDTELLTKFFAVWKDWHLNDMRAHCVHQRDWDISEKIEVVTYHLTAEARNNRKLLITDAARAAVAGKIMKLTPQGKALLELASDWEDIHTPPDADSPLSGCYEVSKREVKAAGWVYPKEHPRGLLTKSCEVCGYNYGSKWNFEELPQDVIEFLSSLPDTDQKPAWV